MSEIIVAHHLRLYESLFKIRMDHTGGLLIIRKKAFPRREDITEEDITDAEIYNMRSKTNPYAA